MITEAAYLFVRRDEDKSFEQDFRRAGRYISSIKGYVKHSLHRCIEVENKYLLLVEWETLEDHTVGFRKSEVYLEWKKLFHHYYKPFPVVDHFEEVGLNF